MRDRVASDAILDRLLQLHPKIIDLTLDRVWRLLDIVGNPQDRLPPVVHIAGTNGKGSTLAMLRAGLESTGCDVHAYTSPHLVRFHERIRLAGRLIEEDVLAALLAECEEHNGDASITFFEITTVAALLAFVRAPADWVLLEVGLGGRLDATNVVEHPRLTVITPVSIDHQQYLGTTIEAITGEKAGILKPGVPCVVGSQSDAALAVIEERAAELGAPLLVFGQDWVVGEERGRLVYQDDRGLLDLPLPVLNGPHQIQNAGIAVAALRALGLSELECEAALLRAEWPARHQRLRGGPLVDLLAEGDELWLDGGHNAAAGISLADGFIDRQARSPADLWLIAGMLDTKAAADFLRPFAPIAVGALTVTIPDTSASLSAEALAVEARMAGLDTSPAKSVDSALKTILDRQSGNRKRILICGSLYLAGSVLASHI